MSMLSSLHMSKNSDLKSKEKLPSKSVSYSARAIKSRLQFSTISPVHASKPETLSEIRIQVDSNYGDKDKVSVCEIDVLNDRNEIIPIQNLTFDKGVESLVDPSFFMNHQFRNDAKNPLWKGQLKKETFSMIFKVLEEPKMLRIWNGNEPLLSSIKDIRIYINRMFITSAEIPLGLGSVIRLVRDYLFDDNFDQKLLIKSDHSNEFFDNFGLIPLISLQVLDITLFKTYDNSDFFGLNSILFVGTKGFFNVDENLQTALVYNGDPSESASSLLRNSIQEVDPLNSWTILKTGPNSPRIRFCFQKPMVFVAIIIINATKLEEEMLSSTKFLEIRFDNRLVWRGCLKTGFIKKKARWPKPTKIFFADCPQSKALVRDILN